MAVVGMLRHKVTLEETASGGPALANDNDQRLLIAWAATDFSAHLNVMARGADGSWTQKVSLPETTASTPALAAGGGRVFLAWAEKSWGSPLSLKSTADPGLQIWDDKITFRESSLAGPALALGDGRLYLAWTGFDKRLNLMSWDVSSPSWSPKVTLRETSSNEPWLAFHDGTLYVLWCGTDRLRSLNAIEVAPDGGVGERITLNETSPHHPALATGADGLPRLAWTGDGNKFLNVAVFGAAPPDGLLAGPADKRTLEETSSTGPALCAFQDTIAIAWKATGLTGALNVAAFPGGATS